MRCQREADVISNYLLAIITDSLIRIVDHFQWITFIRIMLIPLEESTIPLEASYSLRVSFAFLYIICIFKIEFSTIIASCKKKFDILEYFTIILIRRITQKNKLCSTDNIQMPTHFRRYRQPIKQTINTELWYFFDSYNSLQLYNVSLSMFELRQHVIIVSILRL